MTLKERHAELKKICWDFNHGGCSRTDEECRFNHILVKKAEKDKIPRPRSPSSACAQAHTLWTFRSSRHSVVALGWAWALEEISPA